MQFKLKSLVFDVSQDHHLFGSMQKDNEIHPERCEKVFFAKFCKKSLVSYLIDVSYIFKFFPEC